MPILNKGGRRSLDGHLLASTEQYKTRTISDFLDTDYKECAKYIIRSRACPSLCDGLKISGRKVMYSAFVGPTRNGDEVKFLSLSGSVFEKTLYPHGDSGLHDAIFTRGADFSDNLHLLEIVGQHGTLRCPNAKSSPRYLSVKLSKYSKLLKTDWDLLEYVEDEGEVLEPFNFLPIVPLVIVSAQQGLAPGYKFLNAVPMNPLGVVDACVDVIKEGHTSRQLEPYVKGIKQENFTYSDKSRRWTSKGEYSIDLKNNVVKIVDLPYGVTYKAFEEGLNDLADSGKIRDWKNFSQDGNIDYRIVFAPGKLNAMSQTDKVNNLESMLMLTKLVDRNILNVLDEKGKLIYFETGEELTEYFVKWRLTKYQVRKDRMVSVLEQRYKDNSDLCKFIELVNSGKIKIQNRKKSDVKKDLDKEKLPHSVLSIEISKLTDEEKEELLKKNREIHDEIEYVKATSIEDMYLNDLAKLRKELEKDFPEQLNSPKKRSSSKKSVETETVKDLTEEETSEKPKKKTKKTKITSNKLL